MEHSSTWRLAKLYNLDEAQIVYDEIPTDDEEITDEEESDDEADLGSFVPKSRDTVETDDLFSREGLGLIKSVATICNPVENEVSKMSKTNDASVVSGATTQTSLALLEKPDYEPIFDTFGSELEATIPSIDALEEVLDSTTNTCTQMEADTVQQVPESASTSAEN